MYTKENPHVYQKKTLLKMYTKENIMYTKENLMYTKEKPHVY